VHEEASLAAYAGLLDEGPSKGARTLQSNTSVSGTIYSSVDPAKLEPTMAALSACRVDLAAFHRLGRAD